MVQLSVAYTQLGRSEAAITAVRKAYAIDPNDASITLNLGVLLVEAPETSDEGKTFLRHANRLGHRRAHAFLPPVHKLLGKGRS